MYRVRSPSYVVRSLPTCDKWLSPAVSGVALSGLSLSGVSSRDRIDSPAAHSRVSDATGSFASASEAVYLPFRACCVFACNRSVRSCPALRGITGPEKSMRKWGLPRLKETCGRSQSRKGTDGVFYAPSVRLVLAFWLMSLRSRPLHTV